MTDCTGISGRVFGHNFELNYDKTPPNMAGSKLNGDVAGVIEALTKLKYVNSICTRCGLSVAPGKEPA